MKHWSKYSERCVANNFCNLPLFSQNHSLQFLFDSTQQHRRLNSLTSITMYHFVPISWFCSWFCQHFQIFNLFPPLWLPMFFPQVGRGSDQQSGLRWPGGSLEPTAEGRRRRGKQSHQSRRPHHCAEWRWAERRWSPGKVEDLWPARAKGFSWAGDVEIGRVYICAYRITIYIYFCQFNIGPFNDTK